MKGRSSTLALAAAIAGLAGMAGGVVVGTSTFEARESRVVQPVQGGVMRRALMPEAMIRQLFRGSGGSPAGGYRNRPPGTNARTRRAATKRRNVQRNRRAHRG